MSNHDRRFEMGAADEGEFQPPVVASKAKWIWLGILGLFFLAYGGFVFLNTISEQDQPVFRHVIGTPLPALRLEPLAGTEARLRKEDVAGKIVLMNFWGPWCPPCREELPHLAAIEKKFRNRPDFQFLSISYDNDSDLAEHAQKSTSLLKMASGDFPLFHDPYARFMREVCAESKLPSVFPTTLVVDREGIICGVWQGFSKADGAKIERLLEKLLTDPQS